MMPTVSAAILALLLRTTPSAGWDAASCDSIDGRSACDAPSLQGVLLASSSADFGVQLEIRPPEFGSVQFLRIFAAVWLRGESWTPSKVDIGLEPLSWNLSGGLHLGILPVDYWRNEDLSLSGRGAIHLGLIRLENSLRINENWSVLSEIDLHVLGVAKDLSGGGTWFASIGILDAGIAFRIDLPWRIELQAFPLVLHDGMFISAQGQSIERLVRASSRLRLGRNTDVGTGFVQAEFEADTRSAEVGISSGSIGMGFRF